MAETCDDDDFDQSSATSWACCSSNAPLSMWAAKEAVRRLRRSQLPDGDDIVARVFGSDDFHRAVGAFMAKEKVVWTGR